VTVAMSDHDCGLLVEAVEWIQQHAGVDAPSYPALERLAGVMDRVSPGGEPQPLLASTPLKGSADSDVAGESAEPSRSAYHHWRSVIQRTVDTRCLGCGARVTLPDEPGQLACPACGLVMDISATASVRRVPEPVIDPLP
jgi:predicted RNA-binding Zn-ribbon protein involved in translation (DUF1610 family)